ncbi:MULTISPECIES: hypothetical protein [Streptomyces]|nr:MULTISPECIES: hypothetical protein [Streptomyces]MCM8549707.1 hypothetical protein [Streptomyces sp. STCH 565 A]
MASAAVATVTGPLSAGAARAAGPPAGGAHLPSGLRSVAGLLRVPEAGRGADWLK